MRRGYAKKVDTTQTAIVDALRTCGWHVWNLGQPVDLLCWKPGTGFRLLECKTPANKRGDPRNDKRQKAQNDFIALTGTPRVCTPEEALRALGTHLT